MKPAICVAPVARHLDVWIPLPHDDAYQQVQDPEIHSPYPYGVATTASGNVVLHIGIEQPKAASLTVRISAGVTRKEHLQPRLTSHERLKRDESADVLAQYLLPERLVPLDDRIRGWARDVANRAHAQTDLENGAGHLQSRGQHGEI